jgi:2-polyprenyl-3-methyl-5-hydroxy-6-metoxy-1,4-benzoquinol methylase
VSQVDRVDLAGRPYWETQWRTRGSARLRHLSYFRYSFGRLLAEHVKPGEVVCEIGCGGSIWLPFLARRGAEAWGIDYSATGIALASENLSRAGATAKLVEADLFDGTPLPPAQFDLIYSLGFLEHFADGAGVVARIAEFLRPGGVLITLVPNFVGVWGAVQRGVDPEVYAVHVPYTPAALDEAHARGGLRTLVAARYFGGFGPLVVNYSGRLRRFPSPVGAAALGSVWALQQTVSWAIHLSPVPLDTRRFSPYVLGLYRHGPRTAAPADPGPRA